MRIIILEMSRAFHARIILNDPAEVESLLTPLNDSTDDTFKQDDVVLKSDASNTSYRNVIVPTFLYFLVLFGSIPLSYQAIIQQICNELDEDDCGSAHITSRASIVIVYCNIATYAPGLLTTSLYSSVANIYGRKVVMIISLLGIIVYSLLYCYIVICDPEYYVALAVTASFVMGISGSYTTYIMGAFSYVADSTADTPGVRNEAFSVTESCLYLGKIVGPLVAGLYASQGGYAVPFLGAAVLASLAIVYILWIPESLTDTAETRGSSLVLNPLQVLNNIKLLFTHTPKHGLSPLPAVSTAFFLYYFALMGFVVVIYVYMKHCLSWGALMFGLYDSVNGAIQALSMLYVPALVHRLIGRELKLITWVHIGYFCRYVFYLLAQHKTAPDTTAYHTISYHMYDIVSYHMISYHLTLEHIVTLSHCTLSLEDYSGHFYPSCPPQLWSSPPCRSSYSQAP